MGVVVEHFADQKGMIWPEAIAPFKYHLIGLNLEDADVKNHANKVYQELTNAGFEVLFDDRVGVSAGEKFGDADLMGMPIRLVVSAKNGEKIELKERAKPESNLVDLSAIITA